MFIEVITKENEVLMLNKNRISTIRNNGDEGSTIILIPFQNSNYATNRIEVKNCYEEMRLKIGGFTHS